jgi:6,7-dimethyl-8-ribityllumazine synthase
MAREIKGAVSGANRRVAIAVGRFNQLVSERLLSGAVDALTRYGVRADDIQVVWVPGSYELPLACRWLAESGRFDAVLALGAVIRGATSHYDHVCAQAARGILDASLATSVPIAFGVLTCDTLEQALERAGGKAGNKGADAAAAALEMVALRGALRDG